MKKELVYCDCCKRFIDEYHFIPHGQYKVIRGQEIRIEVEEAYCSWCGVVVDVESNNKKIDRMFVEEYRRINGLLTTRQLNQLRRSIPLEQIIIKTKISWLRLKLILTGTLQTSLEDKKLRKLYDIYVKKL